MKPCKGSCLCGAITIEAQMPEQSYHACHCSRCRKLSGGPMMASYAGKEVTINNTQHLTIYDSSDWMERGFCKQCGSALFARLKETQEHFIPVWLFDNAEEFAFTSQIFIDMKPASYCFSNQTKELTEAEVFSQFTS